MMALLWASCAAVAGIAHASTAMGKLQLSLRQKWVIDEDTEDAFDSPSCGCGLRFGMRPRRRMGQEKIWERFIVCCRPYSKVGDSTAASSG
jgi:hypothetical protein